MTDDEVSEFAEALAAVCDEFVEAGGKISGLVREGYRCPLSLLIGNPTRPFPNALAGPLLGLTVDEAGAFIQGVVGLRAWSDRRNSAIASDAERRRFFELGAQFRERYV